MLRDVVLNFAGKQLRVSMCETQEEMMLGLMHTRALARNSGMLFRVDGENYPKFWMKNTPISLDIAYVDDCMKIVKIDRMKPFVGKSECSAPFRFAVEAPIGWFQNNGVEVGCEMQMSEKNSVKSIVDEILNELWERPTSFVDIVYRPFSDMFFQKIREMKERSEALHEGITKFDEFTKEALKTDIGEFGIFEGITVPLDIPIPDAFHAELYESKKNQKSMKLNTPHRGGEAKFHVYVKDPKTKNIKKINFGAKGMSVGINDPARRKSFVARHQCEKKNDKTKAGYWACRLPRYWRQLGLKKTTFKFW